ncbi:MAG: DEAD/DEAH box helicase family protein [Acidimicrobiales bacterium]
MGDPYAVPEERAASPIPLVEALRREVGAWRAGGRYDGARPTTKRLLEHWFLDQHQTPDGDRFSFYFCQREAVETVIYLHEVVGIRGSSAIFSRYGTQPHSAPLDLPYARYVVKMATGSGKTKVMALAMAWCYFSHLYEAAALPTTFLLVAPNLIVLERLRADFDAARIFRDDPIIPPEWRRDFELEVVIRDEPAPMTAPGVLALTNVHVLYERVAPAVTNPVERLLGPRPPATLAPTATLIDRLAERGRLVVVNDEAHHLHDEVRSDTGEPLVALRSLRTLHQTSAGVELQLDLSATPRHQTSALFAEVVVDYPLSAAIDDGIVKRPVIGELHGAVEVASSDASEKYRARIGVGVQKWREVRDALAPAGKKPLLFVMAESTTAADQIAAYLETLPDLSGRVLTIHVNMSGPNRGDIRASDLELARAAAHAVDGDDSPYSAIVSVLMLREGWDVRNVCVIVPLRAYTAASKILPEQTLGRGLRRMTPPGSGADERVIVIEHDAFRSLWEDYAEQEGLDVEFRDVDDIVPMAEIIAVDPGRLEFDIEVPQIPRRLHRAPSGIGDVGLGHLPRLQLPIPAHAADQVVEYRGRDLRSGQTVDTGSYPVPQANDPAAVLAWYVNEVQRLCRLTGQFAALAPLVRAFIEERAFEQAVNLGDPRILYALAQPATQELVVGALRSGVDQATLQTAEGRPAADLKARLLSSTKPFLWSGEIASAVKSVFSRQACDSGLEVQFVGFLDRCPDVAALAKLAPAMRVSMEYRGEQGGLAFYFPDFAVRDRDGDHYLVETKGLVDIAVAAKDQRAAQWCLDATMATGVRWSYLRVDEDLFSRQAPALAEFADLAAAVRAARRADRLRTMAGGQPRSKDDVVRLMRDVSARTRHDRPDLAGELDRLRER